MNNFAVKNKNILFFTLFIFSGATSCTSVKSIPPPNIFVKPSDMIDLIVWLGSLRDLSDYDLLTDELHVTANPGIEYSYHNGTATPNFKSILRYTPISLHSGISASYRVFNPDGTAAHSFGRNGVRRADFTIHLPSSTICILKDDIDRTFGTPGANLLTDGAGSAFTWRVAHNGKWDTYVNAYFGYSANECTTSVELWQQD